MFFKNKLIFKKHNYCEWIHKNGMYCDERAIYNYQRYTHHHGSKQLPYLLLNANLFQLYRISIQ